MDIVGIIRKCDSWGEVECDDSVYGSYFVKVFFDKKDDAKEFAVELMMVTSGQEPYGEVENEVQSPKREPCATEALILAAEDQGPLMHARIGVLRALNRSVERAFNPDRKDPHWGRKKLKRDE